MCAVVAVSARKNHSILQKIAASKIELIWGGRRRTATGARGSRIRMKSAREDIGEWGYVTGVRQSRRSGVGDGWVAVERCE